MDMTTGRSGGAVLTFFSFRCLLACLLLRSLFYSDKVVLELFYFTVVSLLLFS